MSNEQQAVEQPKEMTLEQLQQAYANCCTKAGHFSYQIYSLENELGKVYAEARRLNEEATVLEKAKKLAAEAASAESAKAV